LLSKKGIIYGLAFTLVIGSLLIVAVLWNGNALYWAFEGQKNSISIVNDWEYQNAPRDPYTIENVDLKFDTLILNITYGGGCKTHEFALITTATFIESNPVQVNILLSHNANNDKCLALFYETMAFNLLALKKSWQEAYKETSGTIIIHLEGVEEPITYQF